MMTRNVMALIAVKGKTEFLHVFCMRKLAAAPVVLRGRMALEAEKRLLYLYDLYLFFFLFGLNPGNEGRTAPSGKKERY